MVPSVVTDVFSFWDSYEEVFVVHEGQGTFTVGDTTLEAIAGQIVVVPAGMPHKFINSGQGQLRQTSIHPSSHMIAEWLGKLTGRSALIALYGNSLYAIDPC